MEGIRGSEKYSKQVLPSKNYLLNTCRPHTLHCMDDGLDQYPNTLVSCDVVAHKCAFVYRGCAMQRH